MVPVHMSTAKTNEYSKSWRDLHHTVPGELARLCLTAEGVFAGNIGCIDDGAQR
jgi:hypothetical protein